jgi:hypothetical protein
MKKRRVPRIQQNAVMIAQASDLTLSGKSSGTKNHGIGAVPMPKVKLSINKQMIGSILFHLYFSWSAATVSVTAYRALEMFQISLRPHVPIKGEPRNAATAPASPTNRQASEGSIAAPDVLKISWRFARNALVPPNCWKNIRRAEMIIGRANRVCQSDSVDFKSSRRATAGDSGTNHNRQRCSPAGMHEKYATFAHPRWRLPHLTAPSR